MKTGRLPALTLPGPAGGVLDRLRAVTAAPGGPAPRTARYVGTITDQGFTLRLARTLPSPWRLQIDGLYSEIDGQVVFTWTIGWTRLGMLINELIIGSGLVLAVLIGLYVSWGRLPVHALLLAGIGGIWVLAPLLDLLVEQRRLGKELKRVLEGKG